MTLTNAQCTNVFASGTHMGLTNPQSIALAAEGLTTEIYFIKFDEEELKIAKICTRMGILSQKNVHLAY